MSLMSPMFPSFATDLYLCRVSTLGAQEIGAVSESATGVTRFQLDGWRERERAGKPSFKSAADVRTCVNHRLDIKGRKNC